MLFPNEWMPFPCKGSGVMRTTCAPSAAHAPEPLQTILALAADAVETRHTDQIEPSRSSEHPVGHIFRAIAQSELLDHRIHLRYLSQNFRIDPLPDRIVLPLRIIERKLPLLPVMRLR